MTLKIEKHSDGYETVIRLIGRMRAEHLPALRVVMDESGARLVLDLEDLALVDAEAVRFLARCHTNGIALLHCPQYVRDWMKKEQESSKQD